MTPEPESSLHEDKLYLVTHGNLSPGYQTAQAAHIIAEYAINHPENAKQWNHVSNSLIILQAKDAEALSALQQKAKKQGLNVQEFREPDLGDEITTLLLLPHKDNRKLLSNLPLSGKATNVDMRAKEQQIRQLSFDMMACDQTKGQNVLQHGRSVREHYFALVDHLEGLHDLNKTDNWKLPTWADTYKEQILSSLPSRYIMDRYLTLHDCGKPAVREVDEDGRVHFPNHAESSGKIYRETFGEQANDTVAYLIEHDMEVHMLKAADIPEFVSHETAVAQLLAALSEVTSNAAMFGGVESTSFKIKYKQIDQRGKAIMKALFD